MSLRSKRIPLKPQHVVLSCLDLSNTSPSPIFQSQTTQNKTSKDDSKFTQMKSFFKLSRSPFEGRSSPRNPQAQSL